MASTSLTLERIQSPCWPVFCPSAVVGQGQGVVDLGHEEGEDVGLGEDLHLVPALERRHELRVAVLEEPGQATDGRGLVAVARLHLLLGVRQVGEGPRHEAVDREAPLRGILGEGGLESQARHLEPVVLVEGLQALRKGVDRPRHHRLLRGRTPGPGRLPVPHRGGPGRGAPLPRLATTRRHPPAFHTGRLALPRRCVGPLPQATRATDSRRTSAAPASFRIRAQASAVAPVVHTSSSSTTTPPGDARPLPHREGPGHVAASRRRRQAGLGRRLLAPHEGPGRHFQTGAAVNLAGQELALVVPALEPAAGVQGHGHEDRRPAPGGHGWAGDARSSSARRAATRRRPWYLSSWMRVRRAPS